ncbi:PAS domain S-box protein [Labilibaculum sp. K2S]|uniref:PAS domain S-box protein n=1 Tax=Labilibaculum sp. K2S TaxID=3056386 RepID=UPI0025A3E3DC|nr:PAS domain S-box protein [Labilibaculum sp. K2S]MDM8161850.1 PAS domain S-box protein [Labilibaculum sp. K2S]
MKNKPAKLNKKLSDNFNSERFEIEDCQCQDFIQNLALPVVFLSSEGVITYANQSFLNMLGYSYSEIVSVSVFSIFEWESVGEDPNTIFTNLLKRQKSEDNAFEIQFHRKTGEAGWVAIESFTCNKKSVNGDCLIQCVLRDITREKELQAKTDLLLKEAHNKDFLFHNLIENRRKLLSGFVDNAINPMFALDLDNRFILMNQAFINRHGLQKEELYGKSVEEFQTLTGFYIHEDVLEGFRKASDNRVTFSFECATFQPVLNKLTHTHYTVFPLFSDNGTTLLGTGTIITDVAEFVEYQDRLNYAEKQSDIFKTKARYQEYLLQSYMDSIPFYASIIDLDGIYKFINKYALGLFEDTGESAIGKHYTEFIRCNDYLNSMIMDVEFVLNNHKEVESENVLINGDGGELTFHSNLFPLFDEEGKIFAVGIIGANISKRKRVEEESRLFFNKVQQSERLLSALMNNIPLPVYHKDVNGVYLGGNTAFANSIGFSENEFIGKTVFDLFPNNDLTEIYHQADLLVFKSCQAQSYEAKIKNKDGSFNDVIFNKAPFFNQDGTLGGLVGAIVDITERKRDEEKLWESQQLFRSVLDNIPQSVFWKDKDGIYLGCNISFAKDVGLVSSDEIVGKTDYDVACASQADLYRADDQLVMTNDAPKLNFEESQMTPEGNQIWEKISRIPMHDSKGNVIGVLGTYEDITERKQVVEMMRQSEEKFRLLYNSTPAMLYSIDQEGNLLTVSDYWLIVMGYTREEVLGRALSDFVTKESLQYSREVVWPLFLKNGSCTDVEFQFVKKNGEIIICMLSAIAQWNSDGKLVGSLEVIVDISELRKKEEEVATAQRLLQDFLDNIPYSVAILDLRERLLFANEPFSKINFSTKQELIGKHHNEYISSQKLQRKASEGNAYVLSNQESLRAEVSDVSPDGEEYHFVTIEFPLYNSKDEFSYIGVIIDDVTEQIHRENELKEAKQVSENRKQFLQSFMDNASAAMFAKDLSGKYLLTNNKKQEFHALKKKSLPEGPRKKLLKGSPSNDFNDEDLSVVKAGKVLEFFDSIERENGRMEYFKTLKFPIYDPESKLIAVGGITNDITDSVTREIEVEEARKIAEEAASSQERFLASMSHDMRTPLNGVVGMVNLMEQTSLSAEQKEYLDAMKVSSYNLKVLINDILDISKIQAGKLNIESVLFDLDEILHSIDNVFRHEAKEKGVRFSIEVASGMPTMLEGDPSRLNQILNNLIGNALKFTAKGFVKLSLFYKVLTENKVNIEFVVEDSGIGISEEGLTKLFKPFMQASSDTTRKFGGSGLGLSICKSLVELQLGEISVSSELNKGSIFRFNISYLIAEQANIQSHRQSIKNSVSLEELPSMRCLLAEDNLINQKVVFHVLKKVGISMDIANNGKEAVEILREKAALYQFVLMDIQMPVMDGYKATIIIREELGLQIPIIAMTASVLKGDRESCLEAGMNDFVPKPFMIEELLYVIRKLTKEQGKKEKSLSQPLLTDVMPEVLQSETTKPQMEFGDEPLYSMMNVEDIDDADFKLEILNMFLDIVPKALQELTILIAQATDWDTVTKVAHKLKGSVGILLMNEMIKQLSVIEVNSINREDLDELPKALGICCCIYDAVKDEITKLRDETINNI